MRPRTRQVVYVILAVALMGGATAMVPSIQRERKAAHLVLPPAPDTAAMSRLYTPLLAVARAPLVDLLWLRATEAKDKGRIFDAYQLADMICQLQPKFPDVWAFQAWNMAYNISVTCNAPEERWRWVRNGYEELRDKGIPLNPHSTQLYRELAWILFHKVGDFMDDAHWYYKNEFAKIVEHVLGEPPKGYIQPGRVRGDFYRNYDYPPLAVMPKRFDELFGDEIVHKLVQQYRLTALQPKEVVELLDQEDPDVAAFVKKLGRPGLDRVEIMTLLDFLHVDLLASKAMVEEIRRQASDEASGGIVALLRKDPEAAAFSRIMDRYGFDISAPGVFSGLMNSMRTGKIVMPNTAEGEAQDKKAREFLAILRDSKYDKVREELRQFWMEHAGLDIDPIRKAQRQEAANLKRVIRAIKGLKEGESDSDHGDYGFDVSKKDVYLGIAQAIHDGNLAIPDVEPHGQEDAVAAFMKVWNDSDNERGRNILGWFWHAYRLRHELKLDPMRIVHMNNHFNVIFDYRFAESQSLYWANLGAEVGTDKRVPVDIHRLNTVRIELYCLQKMYYRGRIAMSPEADMGEPPLLSPDLRMVPVLVKAFFDASRPYLKNETGDHHGISVNFETGFVGFMRDAIVTYNEQGYDNDAKKMFDILRTTRPDPMYADGINEFLKKEVPADRELGDYRVTVRRISGLLRQAIMHLAYGESELATRYINRAHEIYGHYHKEMVAKRQKIQFTFEQIMQECMDSFAYRWNRRETYERVCKELGVKPMPESQRRPDSAEAAASSQ